METTGRWPLGGFSADREIDPLNESSTLDRLRTVEELEHATVEVAARVEVWQTDSYVVDHTHEATPTPGGRR
jgi:hypothetical protein